LTGCKVSDSFPAFAAFTQRGLSQRHARQASGPDPALAAEGDRRRALGAVDPALRASDGSVARFLVGAVALGMRTVEKRRLPWPLRDEPG